MKSYSSGLTGAYQGSDYKPDKQYSIGPTVIKLAEPKGKRVLDVGCGSGFFTRRLYWAGASRVIGLDTSQEQIRQAKIQPLPCVEYRLGDVWSASLPLADVVVAPFVANYAESVDRLTYLLKRFYEALTPGGRLVLAVDLPQGRDYRRYGAVKTLLGPELDGTAVQIVLYREMQPICALPTVIYFTPETIQEALEAAGFSEIVWRQPIISREGYEAFRKEFWEGYCENPELGYLTAIKACSAE